MVPNGQTLEPILVGRNNLSKGIPFSDTELSLPLFVILLSFPRLFLEGTGIILFIIFSPILTASSTVVCDAFTAVEMLVLILFPIS